MSPHSRLSRQTTAWIRDAVGPGVTIEAVSPMGGATSSTLLALDLRVHSEPRPAVLRLHTNKEWLLEEPQVARREADNLLAARAAGLPTPELIAFDETGAQAGLPAVLMTRLPGRVHLLPQDDAPWLDRLALALARIHRTDLPAYPWRYASYQSACALKPPAWSPRRDLWQAAIDLVRQRRPAYRERFIHRDYHPVNVLWQGDVISGIVDWANGCTGPAGADVGQCRLNLALLLGAREADRFLTSYLGWTGSSFAYDPYWDLVSILDWLPGPPGVYQGWTDFGVTGLTPALTAERMDLFLESVLARC